MFCVRLNFLCFIPQPNKVGPGHPPPPRGPSRPPAHPDRHPAPDVFMPGASPQHHGVFCERLRDPAATSGTAAGFNTAFFYPIFHPPALSLLISLHHTPPDTRHLDDDTTTRHLKRPKPHYIHTYNAILLHSHGLPRGGLAHASRCRHRACTATSTPSSRTR